MEQIASKAPQLVTQVMQRWNIPQELANDVVKLALYDIILYIGESVMKKCCPVLTSYR